MTFDLRRRRIPRLDSADPCRRILHERFPIARLPTPRCSVCATKSVGR